MEDRSGKAREGIARDLIGFPLGRAMLTSIIVVTMSVNLPDAECTLVVWCVMSYHAVGGRM
jgi:hypothetical protein